MIELIDKRKPNEKHFLKENGNIEIQLFRNNIHYLKDGKYEEISNELKENEDTLENVENDYKVIFNKKTGSIKYIKDDNYLEFIPKDYKNIECILEKNTKEVSKVLYKNIFENIDLEYVLSYEGVKENIIINKYTDVNKLQFYVDSSLDVENENGVLEAKDEKDTLFSFNVPYMKDKYGNESDEVFYEINNNDNGKMLVITFSNDWLKSKERKYPVIIDPTYENNTNVEDTYIYPGDTNDVRYNRDYTIAGVEKINDSDRINRALMRFRLPDDLGPADEIVRAELHLYGYMATEDNRELTEEEAAQNTQKLVNVHELTSDWTLENANWNNMNNSYNISVENVAYISRSYLQYDLSVVPAELKPVICTSLNECLITSLVKKWLNGSPNYGIMIKQAEETYINTMIPKFFSSNYGNGSLAPLLTIEYRNQNGLESYWNYMTQSFTCGATHINTFNGNLVAFFPLVKTIGSFPASIGIVYNTNDVIQGNNSIYGKGYKLTYDQTLKDISDYNKKVLEYYDSDGTVHIFYGDSQTNNTNVYYDIDGLNLIIESNDNNFVMKDKNGNSMIFELNDSIYYLKTIKDISEKTINIQRNKLHNITKIVDYNSNEINISYNNDNIVFVSPEEMVTINFENNNLKTILTKFGTILFYYDTSNKITEIIDVNGTSVVYEYLTGNTNKIRKVIQYGLNKTEGQSYTFDYNLFNTMITDNNGLVKSNTYNCYGNLLSSNNMSNDTNIKDAYSISKIFGNDDENKNKLIIDTIPIKYTKNYSSLTNYDDLHEYAVFSNNMSFSNYYDDSFEGVNLIEFVSDDINQYSLIDFSLPDNRDYTISLYIKTSLLSRIKFYITISEVIYEKELVPSTGYEKIEFTFNKNSSLDLIMKIEHPDSCSTYIGDINIQEGVTDNDYNIITNSDFSNGLEGWTLSASDLEDVNNNLNPTDYIEVVDIDSFENRALKINMKSENITNISKIIPIKGTSNDIFYLSFWYKNNGLETDIDPTNSYDSSGSIVGNTVSVVALPQNGEVEHCVPATPLNACRDVWQYCHLLFAPTENYRAIRIDLHQGRNAGILYLTNFSLIKKIKTNQYEYDEYGNVTKVNRKNDSSIFNYDEKNELISATNPRGRHFKFEYHNNISDRVLRAISSSGISNRMFYDEYGNLVKSKISKDYTSDISTGCYKIRQKGTNDYLKINNNLLSVKSDYCSNTIFKITKVNNYYMISDVVLPNKYITEDSGNVVIGNVGNKEFFFEKNNNASYHVYLEDLNNSRKYLKRISDNHFEFVDDYSDIDGNFLYEFYFEEANKLFMENDATYTQDGRFITKFKDSLLNETLYSINNTNGLLTKITNSLGNEINYTYNNKQQIVGIFQENKELEYVYNTLNLLEEINQGNKTYAFNYDNFLNVNSISLNNICLINYNYESNNGNLLSIRYGNDGEISYKYDRYGRIKKIVKENDTFEYVFNNNGLVSKLIGNDSSSLYNYDSNKRIKEIVCNRDNNVFVIDNNFDEDNNIIKQKISLNTTSHTINRYFDIEGNELETNIDNATINYCYDDLDRVIKKKINNDFEIKFDYVSIGNRTSQLVRNIINGSNKYSYKYDKLNNIVDIYLNDDLINCYTYDNYNQLVKDENYENNTIIEYIYNNEGNILLKVKKDLQTSAILSSDSYVYNNLNWEDLLTKYNNEIISYDSIGNPISIGNKILSWINGKQLNTYVDGNLSVSYKYNLNGIRTKKVVNGVETEYYLEGNSIVYEKTNDSILFYLYDSSGIVGLEYNNVVYYFLKNVQGDIVGIINSDNQLIAKYEYDAYGNILSIMDGNGQDISDQSNIGLLNPFRFRGYYYDKETGFYYLNTRYYEPRWGRFINADDYIGANKDLLSQNLFIYCSNNPIHYVDNNGAGLLADFFNGVVDIGKKAVDGLVSLGSAAVDTVGGLVNNALDFGHKVLGLFVNVKFTISKDYEEKVCRVPGTPKLEIGGSRVIYEDDLIGGNYSLFSVDLSANTDPSKNGGSISTNLPVSVRIEGSADGSFGVSAGISANNQTHSIGIGFQGLTDVYAKYSVDLDCSYYKGSFYGKYTTNWIAPALSYATAELYKYIEFVPLGKYIPLPNY